MRIAEIIHDPRLTAYSMLVSTAFGKLVGLYEEMAATPIGQPSIASAPPIGQQPYPANTPAKALGDLDFSTQYQKKETVKWNNDTAIRYWNGNNSMAPETSLVIGIGSINKDQWQIWINQVGVYATGTGEASLKAALAKQQTEMGQTQSALVPTAPLTPTTPDAPEVQQSTTAQQPPTIAQAVAPVSGDEWNRQLEAKLDQDYANALPKIDNIVQEVMAKNPQLPTPSEDDDDDEGGSIGDWDSLPSWAQEQAESSWKEAHYDSYLESEHNFWQEEHAHEEAIDQVIDAFENGQNEWLADAVDGYLVERNENGLPPLPYSNEQILNAIILRKDPHTDDVEIKFDDDQLQEPSTFTQHETLPGFEPRNWAAELPQKIRQELEKVIEASFEQQVDDTNVEPPDYLSDAANESLDTMWEEMNDDEKYEYAKENVNGLDEEMEQQKQGILVSGLPQTFDPLNETSGDDYKKTQALAKYLSETRAAQLVIDRGIWRGEGTPQSEISQMDGALWKGWKDSSTSDHGLILQIASAEELGGRLRMDPQTRERVIDWANRAYGSIGGYEGVKAIVRAKWETTQYLLDKAGMNMVYLYRAVSIPEVTNENQEAIGGFTKLPDVSLQRNGAASTTTYPDVANGWDGGSDRVVLRIEAPRTAAVSVPAFGQNIHSEHEVVLAGTVWSAWDAWFGKAPRVEEIPIQQNKEEGI